MIVLLVIGILVDSIYSPFTLNIPKGSQGSEKDKSLESKPNDFEPLKYKSDYRTRKFEPRDFIVFSYTEHMPEYELPTLMPQQYFKLSNMITPLFEHLAKEFYVDYLYIIFENFRDREMLMLHSGYSIAQIYEDFNKLKHEFERLKTLNTEKLDYKDESNALRAIMESELLRSRLFERASRLVKLKTIWDDLEICLKIVTIGNELYILTTNFISQEFKAFMRQSITKCGEDIVCVRSYDKILDRLFIEFAKLCSDFRYIYKITSNYLFSKFIINEVIISYLEFPTSDILLQRRFDLYPEYESNLNKVASLLKRIAFYREFLFYNTWRTIEDIKNDKLNSKKIKDMIHVIT